MEAHPGASPRGAGDALRHLQPAGRGARAGGHGGGQAGCAEGENEHIRSVMRDRAVNVRGNALAEMNAQNPTPHGLASILKVAVDGIDQAKFKTPRCAVGPGQTRNRSRVRG